MRTYESNSIIFIEKKNIKPSKINKSIIDRTEAIQKQSWSNIGDGFV